MDLLHERYIGISLPHAAHKHQSALAAWGCRPQEDAEGTLTLVVSGGAGRIHCLRDGQIFCSKPA